MERFCVACMICDHPRRGLSTTDGRHSHECVGLVTT
jgi:hypothetical protein